ncbi:Cupin domain-containing protein [Lentzea albidocapillata subsp. violacea]|uniref:Cupin domain-containing protein n=1 Tax=Lentzea albidocapillata subsp. violacea TaxID=128104 RepID=A0A1G8R940_9PSEU|nr:cupin domain-containing protein [Lentzea albidocapillata]SDJ13476.1 Cupin domain-containing protein [Lentzea albidocapillata subsp. violacea]
MEPDLSKYQLDGDNSMYRLPSGLVAPVVTRGGAENPDTANSGGAVRISGVSIQHTPATKLWFGKVTNEPGYRSVTHHHGEAETGGYVLSGRARIYFGEKFEDYVDMEEGDWVFVPPFMPHIECNLDRNRSLTWMTTRTPENIVVNLDDVPDEDLRDWLTR